MFTSPHVDPDKPTRVQVDTSKVHTMAEGLGFNWYASFPPEVYPAPDDEERWERILGHATWLNINFVRYGIRASDCSEKDGTFRPGAPAFDQLRRVNAWPKVAV